MTDNQSKSVLLSLSEKVHQKMFHENIMMYWILISPHCMLQHCSYEHTLLALLPEPPEFMCIHSEYGKKKSRLIKRFIQKSKFGIWLLGSSLAAQHSRFRLQTTLRFLFRAYQIYLFIISNGDWGERYQSVSVTLSPGWLLEWTLVLLLCWQYWPPPFWTVEQSLTGRMTKSIILREKCYTWI